MIIVMNLFNGDRDVCYELMEWLLKSLEAREFASNLPSLVISRPLGFVLSKSLLRGCL